MCITLLNIYTTVTRDKMTSIHVTGQHSDTPEQYNVVTHMTGQHSEISTRQCSDTTDNTKH